MNTSIGMQEQDVHARRGDWIEELVEGVKESVGEERPKKKSGRPQQVPWVQIVAGVLLSVLGGMNNYQQLWRRLRRKSLAGYAPISVQDDAIINRLKHAGTEPFERLLRYLGQQPVVEGTAQDLARFAPQVVAIDEMTGDQMQRHLKPQRSLKKGDPQLLPGKLAGRYTIRSQQWEVQANCKVEVMSLLAGLEPGSLVLFDLGYFAFWWFDELSQRGYHWVSRLREKTSYRLAHVFWRFEGNIDALIWLGAYRADRAGQLVRLVRVWDGEQLHSYISNVLDPRVLSSKEIVQLYARRWDVELAFLLLKEYLGLHQWWSSQPVLLQQQCLAVIAVAQLVQRLRMQMAVQAGVDAFDVSLPLLLEVLPELLQEKQEPLEWMRTWGREVGVIRPSSRGSLVVPEVKEPLLLPAAGMTQQRSARYHSYGQEPETSCEQVTPSKTATAKKREKKKEEVALQAAREANRQEKRAHPAAKAKKNMAAEEKKGGRKKSKRGREKEKEKQLQTARKKGLPQLSG